MRVVSGHVGNEAISQDAGARSDGRHVSVTPEGARLRLAIKQAVDEGDYEGAGALLDVAMRMVRPRRT